MIINGNALAIPLRNKVVQCTPTSPPYYMLRNYGVIGQLGDERTPDEFITNLVAVFSEVYRVSRDDCTLWLNIADTQAGSAADRAAKLYGLSKTKLLREWGYHSEEELDIPFRLKQALRSIGWHGRHTVIWNKLNPMPESVTDRPTKAHEYIFLLTKSARYYYDAEAVRESQSDNQSTIERYKYKRSSGRKLTENKDINWNDDDLTYWPSNGRNLRSVWTMATQAYSGAHYATFPEELAERCIKAGTSERGACPKCGKGWVRVVEKGELRYTGNDGKTSPKYHDDMQAYQGMKPHHVIDKTTTGWLPSCKCNAGDPIPCLVFDPFVGSGTTVKVAYDLGRVGVGLDLSVDYLAKQATKRIHNGHTGRLL